MLQYIILNKALEKLVPGDEVLFYLPSGKTYQGQISLGEIGYYCYLSNINNARIFEELEIYDANDFVKKIVGYDCKGDWPEVKTLDDFQKIIKALDDECIKKGRIQHNSTEPNRNTSQLKVGDKVKILPVSIYLSTCTDGMQKYVGQLATITTVSKYDCKIDLDNGTYYWPHEVLQLVTSEIDKTVDPHELKNGDYIKITDNLAWNSSTKQVERIGIVDVVRNDLTAQSENLSYFYDSTQRVNSISIGIPSCTKEEKQTEIELNLFPKKKHYQLNFNY